MMAGLAVSAVGFGMAIMEPIRTANALEAAPQTRSVTAAALGAEILLLHRQFSSLLTEGRLEQWRPVIERSLQRLRSGVTGHPHSRNLDRWDSLVERGDVLGLHRVLTGLDRDSIEIPIAETRTRLRASPGPGDAATLRDLSFA